MLQNQTIQQFNETDPSGFFLKKLWNKIRPFVGIIVGAVLTYFCGIYCGQAGYSLFVGAAAGAAGAAANGGNILAGAITGLVSAAVFQGICGNFTKEGNFWAAGVKGGARHILAHATAGGTLSVLQGGKFGHGFVSAGLTKGFDSHFDMNGTGPGAFFAETAVVSVVGGSISKATGGKFANGAATAAFSYAMTWAASKYGPGGKTPEKTPPENQSQEAETGAQHLTDAKAKKGMALTVSQAEVNMADASQLVDAYFIANPEAMPEGLVSGLTFEYVHEIHPTAGAVQRMLPNPETGRTMVNGRVQMYAGSVNTVEDAVLTILHEYGHHSTAAINARQGRVYQTPRAERAADNYARRIANEIF